MGAVGSFIKDVAKTVAKGATSALGAAIPYVGPALADKVNSLYARGGQVLKRADGGVVPGGKAINTPAQLIDLIKKFPDQAESNGLSVEMVKEEVKKMARGGIMARGRGGMAKGGAVMACSHGYSSDSMDKDHGMSRPNPMMYGGMKGGGKNRLRLF